MEVWKCGSRKRFVLGAFVQSILFSYEYELLLIMRKTARFLLRVQQLLKKCTSDFNQNHINQKAENLIFNLLEVIKTIFKFSESYKTV